jgi:hypothetical protein
LLTPDHNTTNPQLMPKNFVPCILFMIGRANWIEKHRKTI